MTSPTSTPDADSTQADASFADERDHKSRVGRLGLWTLTLGHRRRYGVAMVSMAVGILLLFVIPTITQHVIDGFPASSGREGPFEPPPWLANAAQRLGFESTTAGYLVLAALCVLLLTACAGIFQYLRGRLAAQASERILQALRIRLYGRLMDLPAEFFDASDTGDLVQRCTSDVDTVRLFLSNQVVEIGRAVLLVACALPMMFSLNANLAWVTLSLAPIIVAYSLFFFRRLTAVFKEVDEAEGRMTSVLQENLTGIRVVRSFGRQDFEEAKFESANHDHRDKTQRLFSLLALFWSISDAICLTQLGLVLFFGAHWVLTGDLSLGTMVAFTQYVGMIIWPVRQMGRTLVDAGKARVSLKRLSEILEHPLEAPALEHKGESEPSLTGDLDVRNLHFRFPSKRKATTGNGAHEADTVTGAIEQASDDPDENIGGSIARTADSKTQPVQSVDRDWVLGNLTFHLKSGQTLALVGPPGSGKSTLVQLLLGLYDYTGENGSGSIQLDGHELAGLQRAHIRRNIAAVLQNPFLYAKSVEDNLKVGRSGAHADEVRAATEAASLHSAIEGFDKGYATLIGERGVTLSGGQKQRTAIARALLKNAPFLILDDALSAVDHQTEQQILSALRKRAGEQTTLIISHRLSSVAHADLILVMHQGSVVEQGTHAELLQKGQSYAHLWGLQNRYQASSAKSPDLTKSSHSTGSSESTGTANEASQ